MGCSYVITSVEQGNATRTNSFALEGSSEEEKRFEDERLEVTPVAVAAMARSSEAPALGPDSDRMPESERLRKERAC